MPPEVVLAIFLLPFLSFVIISFIIRPLLSHRSQISGYVTIAAIGTSLLLSVLVLTEVISAEGHVLSMPDYEWLAIGDITIHIGVTVDSLSAVMLIVVTSVSLLVQIYSQGYMRGDPGYSRYFAFMSLFTGSMLGLVLADNLLFLFLFWEGVGLCSYLLIGFWFHKPEAARAAMKAFLVTRLGDFGFLAAILFLYTKTGTFDIGELQHLALAGAIHLGRHRHLLRGGGQVGAVPPPYLAARCHGGPDASECPDPCRHHGCRRCLPGGSHVPCICFIL